MGLVLAFNKGNAQPSFTVAAAIAGTAEVGQTLTCTYTVVRAKTVTVRWYRRLNSGSQPVEIGTGATFTLTGNEFQHQINAVVTASNNAGSVQSASDYTAAVTNTSPPEPPTIASPATISGTVEVGSTLTVAVAFIASDTVAYQWYSYTSAGKAGAVALGTSMTQALAVAQDGKYIGCEATGTNATGSTVSAAAVVGPVAALSTEAPTIISAAVISLDDGADGYNEGEYIICDAEFSGWTGTPSFTWYKCDNANKDNPVELTGEGEASIRPLFVSEPNQWRGALFLNQSLGLNTGTKRYVYCVAAAANGEGTTPSASAAVGPIGAIQGAQITQAMVGDGPYVLPLANVVYYLQENITTQGSGIIANKTGQKLNLNGKTLTFDNATPTGLLNGGFETGDFTGWKTSSLDTPPASAPSASIYTVTNALADWNLGRYSTGSHSCLFGPGINASPLTEQVISQSSITLTRYAWYAFSCVIGAPANSTTTVTLRVKKGGETLWSRSYTQPSQYRGMRTLEVVFQAYHADPIYDFELGVVGTVGESSVVYIDDVQLNRTRTAGFAAITTNYDSMRSGDYLEITAAGSGYSDGVYTSVQSMHAGGETLVNSGAYPYLNVTVSGGQVVAASINMTGVSAFTNNVTFFTNNTEVTVPAESIGGTGSGFRAKVAGLRITRYQYGYAADSGIAPLDHTTKNNSGSGRVVKNGTIVQGQDSGTFSAGVFVGSTIGIHRVRATVSGHNGCAVIKQDVGSIEATVCDSVLTVDHRVNTNRDYVFGAVVRGLHGTFARNVVFQSAGGGFYPESKSSANSVQVYGNRFYSKMHHTNQSCLNVGGVGTKVHDNLIDNTGDYYGRCMHLRLTGNVEVYNNVIKMQPSLWNAEYTGTQANGDPAVQFERGDAAGVMNFHDNTVECYAPDAIATSGKPVWCGCMRWASMYEGIELRIANNTLIASALGAGYAFPWLTAWTKDVPIVIEDNTITTDSGYWSGSANRTSNARRERLTLLPSVADQRRLFVVENAEGSGFTNPHLSAAITDLVASGDDLATLVTQGAWVAPAFGNRYESSSFGGFRIKWTITIATGSEGAAVVIKDSGNNTVASGTSEANGNFVAELQQVYIAGQTPTNTANYTVQVNANTPVAFTADSVKTVSAPA